MAIHSTILAWRIPWTEESGRLWSTGSQRVGHNWSALAHTHPLLNSSCCRIFYSAFFFFPLPWVLLRHWGCNKITVSFHDLGNSWYFLFTCYFAEKCFQQTIYISYKSLEIFSSNIFAEPHCGRVGGNLYAPCSLIFLKKKNRVIIFSTAIKIHL